MGQKRSLSHVVMGQDCPRWNDKYAEDPVLKPVLFREVELDHAVRDILMSASDPSLIVEKIRASLSAVRMSVREAASERVDDLVASAAEVLDTQSAVQGVAMSTKYLHSGAQRWQAELSITRFDISSGTARLANALAAAELVYLLRQGIKLVSRIRRVVADSAEEIASSPHSHAHEQMPRVKQDAMAPLARAVRDARTMPGLQRLARLSVVAEEQKFLRGVEGALWDQAQELMHAGLDSGVTTDIADALSVFSALGRMDEALRDTVALWVGSADKAFAAALGSASSTPAPSAPRMAALMGGGQAGRGAPVASEGDVAAVEGLESAMGVVERVVFAAWRVDEVLRRVQGEEMDWDGVREEGSVVGMVWKGVSKSLRERLSAALSKSAGLRGALASRAPKVLQSAERVLSSLHDRAGPPRGKERGVLTHREGRDLLSALSPAVHAYGEAVQQRLQDRVSLTFNAPGTLSAGASAVASMQRAVAEIHNAVRGGQGSATISESVAGHVARTLRALAERTLAMRDDPEELEAIAGPCTPEQESAVQLFSCLQEVHRGILSVRSSVKLDAVPAQMLADASDELEGAAMELIRPIVRGYSAAIESAVCAMHGTEGPQMSRGTAGAGSEPSPFVGTLVEVLAKSNADLFSRLSPPIKASQPTLGLAVALHLASRCLTLLVRHACILRFEASMQMQIVRDLSEIEVAITQHVVPVEATGGAHDAVKALKRVVLAADADAAAEARREGLPALLAAHHLLSRTGGALRLPHEARNVTTMEYSVWLDASSAGEVAGAVRDCAGSKTGLDASVEAIRMNVLEMCS